MKYKIESGIPVPVQTRGNGHRRYPFNDMKPGDSFCFPVIDTKNISSAASAYANKARKRGRMITFTIAKVDDNTRRIWCIEAK